MAIGSINYLVAPDPVGDKNDSGYADQQQQMVKDLRNEHPEYDDVSNHDPQTYRAWVNQWKRDHGQSTSHVQPSGQLAGGHGAAFAPRDGVALSPEARSLLSA